MKVKLVDSKKEQLNYAAILHLCYENNPKDPKYPNFTVWSVYIATILSQVGFEGKIVGNTFFMYKRGQGENQDKAIIYAMNADALQTLVDNVAEFVTQLAEEGVTNFIACYRGAAITRVLRQGFKRIGVDGDEFKVLKNGDDGLVAYAKLTGGA